MSGHSAHHESRVATRVRRQSSTLLAALVLISASWPSQASGADGRGSADTSRVFATWEEWETAHGDLVAAMDAFEDLTEEPIESPARLLAVLEARDRVFRAASGPEGYLYLRLQLSGADEEARSRQHLLDATERRWHATGASRFDTAVTDLGKERIDTWLASDVALRPYTFFFRRFFDRADHPYPEGQEEFRTLAGIARRQSSRVYNALAVAEAPALEVELESGERMSIKPGPPRTILGELSSQVDRRAVSAAWLEALGRQSQTYAALLEGIVGHEKLVARVRGFDSALSAKYHSDAVAADTVRSVIRLAREGSAPLRRYHALKKKALAIDEYRLADRFVPLDPLGDGAGREIDFDEARRLVVASSATLGPVVQELVNRSFSEGWIDSIERPGKRPNAGSTVVAGQPFVFVNYRGSIENVFQLAHEIGHAVHGFLAHHAQPFVSSHRSSLTSEAVASVFEGVLAHEMTGPDASPEERVRVLDLLIQSVLRLFYRPMLDADFELRLYETDGPITGTTLGALYLAVVSDFYGETVTLDERDAHGWQRTPHFFTSPLYLGKYGLASAAANILIPRLTSPVDSEAETARRAFLDLMRAGSSAYPLDLLRSAGAELDGPRTREVLVARFEALVDELERALDDRASPRETDNRSPAQASEPRPHRKQLPSSALRNPVLRAQDPPIEAVPDPGGSTVPDAL